MYQDRPILLSVIVPAYNVMDCLEKCIESIRKQTIPNIEIIIVDDGSTDNTGALAEKLALIDKRIRVFHQENKGSSAARNVGIENSKGEYLGFVDSDDYIEPMMYERMLRVAMSEKIQMVQTSRDEINSDNERLPAVCIPPTTTQIVDSVQILRELLLHRGDCYFCTRITHASWFKSLRFPEGELNEDFMLLVRMLDRVKKVAILPFQDYHVYYRLKSNSRTENENEFPSVYKDIVVNADRATDIVKNGYPMLLEEVQRFALYQRLDYMLHIPISMMKGSNEFYVSVKRYLRKNKWKALKNQYLTKKNKQYIFILGTVPQIARKIHRIKMKGNK